MPRARAEQAASQRRRTPMFPLRRGRWREAPPTAKTSGREVGAGGELDPGPPRSGRGRGTCGQIEIPGHAVHLARERDDQEAPGGVLAERRGGADRQPRVGVVEAARQADQACVVATGVAIDVSPGERGQRGVAHHHTADDGAVRRVAVIAVDGRDVAGERAGIGGGPGDERPLAGIPSEVRTPSAAPGGGREVDLLRGALAHVADHEVSGLAVDREPEGVAKPVAPDEVVAGDTDERVRGRDGEVARVIPARVEAQHLAEPAGDVARVCAQTAAPIARRGVEEPVGAELHACRPSGFSACCGRS